MSFGASPSAGAAQGGSGGSGGNGERVTMTNYLAQASAPLPEALADRARAYEELDAYAARDAREAFDDKPPRVTFRHRLDGMIVRGMIGPSGAIGDMAEHLAADLLNATDNRGIALGRYHVDVSISIVPKE